MLSGQIGQYKYYTLEDMHNSAGCQMCHARTSWWNNTFPETPESQHDLCLLCPIFMAVALTKVYAKQLDEYEKRYADDRK